MLFTFKQWFTAIYAGLIAALYWCLLVNGFVGFQWAEDGTPMSLWVCRLCHRHFPHELIVSCQLPVYPDIDNSRRRNLLLGHNRHI
jgi:hypothetical protein